MPYRTFESLRFALAAAAVATGVWTAAALAATPPATGRLVAEDLIGEAAVDSIAPTVLVLSPNAYQVWAMGTLQKIRWKATDDNAVTGVDLDFSADSGATWTSIATGLTNSGLHTWKVPNVRTSKALIRVSARDSAGNASSDPSNATFEIKDRLAPTMSVTTPNGGQVWLTGSVHKVTWKATDNVGVVRVDLSYSRDGGATWTGIANRLANTGSYLWTCPANVVTANALFRAAAADSAGNSTSDVSNAPFEIRDGAAPTMAVTTPNGGQLWDAGLVKTVTWKATDNIRVTAVDLDWSPDSGRTWRPIARDLPNTGKHLWTIPGPPTTVALFRATARDSMGNATSDLGNAPFTIRDLAPPTATLLAPNGGEVWTAASAQTITWTAADNAGEVAIDLAYSADGGATWTPIAAGLANSGSHAWTAPAAPTTEARVRVVARDGAGLVATDAGDASFEVRAAVPPAPATLRKFLSLRADSADGAGPYPAPGHQGPWVDLAGDHDATLAGFAGTVASGWAGDGTPGNPRRLEFGGEEPGWNNRVFIPGHSVPELQSIGALSAAVWFRTGFDGPQEPYEYVLEWVQRPAVPFDPEFEGRGMSIIVQNGRLQVYANPWIDVGAAAPNAWYHVAVVKDTNEMRIYVNGEQRHSGTKSHRGLQESEIVLGASIFRRFEDREGDAAFSDFFSGAVAQLDLWEGKLGGADVLAAFRADSALYLSPPPLPIDSAVVRLDAAFADGVSPPAVPGAAAPWVDLAAPGTFGLIGVDGTATSGWAGDGSPGSPWRLELDGVDDAAAIDAAGVPELLAATAITTELRFRTGADVSHADFRYVAEWLHAFGASPGLSVTIAADTLRLYAGSFTWTNLAAVQPQTWYRLVIVKAPGLVRAYLDGALVHASDRPNFGVPSSGIVLGASTWRGPGEYGDHLAGAIASLTVWARALDEAEITGPVVRVAPRFERSAATVSHALSFAGAHPNPARGALDVHFALPAAGAGTLEMIDVSGRRIEARDLGGLGAGRHTLRLGAASLRPGVYWLRLVHSGRALTRRAVVVP